MASSSEAERKFVAELIVAEESLKLWAEENAARWTILRPTLIYGLGMDNNVGVIAGFIQRFHFFPILGKAGGLRQPIHVRDVASACKAALERKEAVNQAYNISGAEILSYREMVTRIFKALDIRPRFLSIPLWMFAVGVSVLRVLPPFKKWSTAMAERMNQDMKFDHAAAASDFGFSPQTFHLDIEDLPRHCR
jgi:nucleoside-diphosphate-sugar epimerase